MGLWSRVRSMFGSDVSPDGQSMLSAIFPSGVPPKRGSRELMMAYRNLPWLHAAVRKVSERMASTIWRLYRLKRGVSPLERHRAVTRDLAGNFVMPVADEVTQHPILNLMKRPNPALHRIPFWQMLAIYLEIKGECPMIIERASDGTPVELWVTPPHWMLFTPTMGDPTYKFQWNAWRRNIPESDVVYLRHPDPENPYARGTGNGEAMADEIDIDEFAAKHIASYFYNRAMPDVFVSMKGVKNEKQAQEWEERIRNKYRGSQRAWQVHVTNAEIEVKTVAQNFNQLQMKDLRVIQRDTVLQVIGVPPEIMGISENSNRATADTADYIFAKHVLVPRLDFMADALTTIVQDEYDDALFFAYESPVEEDAEFQLEVMTAQPTLFTKNEWRRLARQPPRAGWDNEFALPTPGAQLPAAAPGEEPSELPGATSPQLEPENPTPEEPGIPDEDVDDEGGEAKGARGPRLLSAG